MHRSSAHSLDDLSSLLLAQGAAVWDQALSPHLAECVRAEVLALRAGGRFVPATVGKARRHRPDIRSDEICWLLPECAPALTSPTAFIAPTVDPFLAQPGLFALRALLEVIRCRMSQDAFVFLDETEMLASHFRPGASYVPHVDRFRGTTDRVFTFVYFLNLNWIETDGGKLHLMGEGEQLIAPIHGRLALFHTPDLLHEVTVTSVDRFAVTGWLGKKAR